MPLLLLRGHNPDRRSTTTYVTCPVALSPGTAFQIRKKTKSIQALLDRQLGGPRVETGSAEFDGQFIVKSRNAGATRSFLTAEIQSALLAFEETVDVKLKNNQFILTVDEIVRTESTLDRMIDLTVLAHDAMQHLPNERSAASPTGKE